MSLSSKNCVESESRLVLKDKVRKIYKLKQKDSADKSLPEKMNYPVTAQMINSSVVSEKTTSMVGLSKIKVRGKTAHTCKVCGKEDQLSNLKVHIRRHHTMFRKRKAMVTCKL